MSMINDVVVKMNLKIDNLKKLINEDISDIKEANHETLLKRNELKQTLIDDIIFCKSELNKELVLEIQKGVDVNIYRAKVDELENNINRRPFFSTADTTRPERSCKRPA